MLVYKWGEKMDLMHMNDINDGEKKKENLFQPKNLNKSSISSSSKITSNLNKSSIGSSQKIASKLNKSSIGSSQMNRDLC